MNQLVCEPFSSSEKNGYSETLTYISSHWDNNYDEAVVAAEIVVLVAVEVEVVVVVAVATE